MKAFITGGSGFIGSHVILKLVARGYDVYALARSKSSADRVKGLGATAVRGDITDIESMRAGMAGSNVVFHLAGWYKLYDEDWTKGEIINVGGTRKVLSLAHELGVPKIIYISSSNILGDTKGQLVDESHYYDGPLATDYERTKWLAHYKVALPLIEKGAPITIVMPGTAYGPEDSSLIGDLMQRFYLGHFPFPVLFAPSTTFTFTHVEDIAEGIILAAEKGTVGESYILAGPAVPLGEMVDFWARLTGKRPPSFHVPAAFGRSAAPLVNLLSQLIDLPEIITADAVAMMGATYMADSSKARAQLGWQPRSLQQGMLETLGYIAAKAAERPMPTSRGREWITVALGAAVVFIVMWLFWRNQRQETRD